MRRFATIALAAALVSAVAVPAFALPARAPTELKEGHDKKFPMAAAEFRAHVAKRQEKARAKMEEHVAKLPKEKADEIRAKFASAFAKINEKVETVCADGTVTKEEAHEVKALAKSLWHEAKRHEDHPA